MAVTWYDDSLLVSLVNGRCCILERTGLITDCCCNDWPVCCCCCCCWWYRL